MSELAAYYAGDRAALVSALLRHGFAGQSDAAADELIRAGWRRARWPRNRPPRPKIAPPSRSRAILRPTPCQAGLPAPGGAFS
jgi:hypothetical protein